MPKTSPKPIQQQNLVQLIVFALGDEEFAVGIGDLREIVRAGAVTPMPDSPPFIKGVSNIRGEIAAIIDLKERFSLHQNKDTEFKHIVITDQEKNLFGLLVDEVTEVLRIPETEIKDAPELVSKIHGEYVKGVVTIDERLIIYIDLNNVLSESELAKWSEIKQKAPVVNNAKAGQEKKTKSGIEPSINDETQKNQDDKE